MVARDKELRVRYVGDTTGVSKALAKLDDEHGRFEKTLGAVGKIGATAFAAVGAAAAGAIGIGVKVASDTQQAQIGFETMLGSAEKARAFLGELQAFAAKTPFEFPELRDAASRLVAVGFETSKVIPLMTALGDATSGMGTGAQGIDQAVRALTQMQQKGKVTGEEMLQLAEAGIPAWDALATKLGVDVPKAQEMVTKGQVKVNDLMAAIAERAGPSFQRLQGMMEKQSQTLAGMVSTVKDTVMQQLGTLAQPIVQGLTRSLPQFTAALQSTLGQAGPQFASLVQRFMEVLTPLVPKMLEVAGAMAGSFGATLKALLPLLNALLPPLTDLLVVLAPIAGPIAAIAVAASGLTKVFGTLTSVVGMVTKTFGLMNVLLAAPVLLAIGGVVAAIILLIKHWDTVKAVALNVWDAIRTGVKAAIDFIVDLFVNFSGPGIIIKHWESIKSVTLAVWNGIRDTIRSVIDSIAGFFERLGNAMRGIFDWFGRTIDTVQRFGRELSKLTHAIPDWLIPGSPTPFEMGLRGIAAAMSSITRVPVLQVGTSAPGAVGATTVVVNVQGSVMAERDLAETIRRVQIDQIRRGG